MFFGGQRPIWIGRDGSVVKGFWVNLDSEVVVPPGDPRIVVRFDIGEFESLRWVDVVSEMFLHELETQSLEFRGWTSIRENLPQ